MVAKNFSKAGFKYDKVAKSLISVIPAQAGIQKYLKKLDAGSSPA